MEAGRTLVIEPLASIPLNSVTRRVNDLIIGGVLKTTPYGRLYNDNTAHDPL